MIELVKKAAFQKLKQQLTQLAGGKAFPLTNAATGTILAHGFGTLLELPTSGYVLTVTGLDAQGDEVSGIRAQKTTPDTCTLVFDDGTATFSGTIVLRVTPL